MSRPEQERLLDILAACEAIASHLDRESLDDDVRRSRSGGCQGPERRDPRSGAEYSLSGTYRSLELSAEGTLLEGLEEFIKLGKVTLVQGLDLVETAQPRDIFSLNRARGHSQNCSFESRR